MSPSPKKKTKTTQTPQQPPNLASHHHKHPNRGISHISLILLITTYMSNPTYPPNHNSTMKSLGKVGRPGDNDTIIIIILNHKDNNLNPYMLNTLTSNILDFYNVYIKTRIIESTHPNHTVKISKAWHIAPKTPTTTTNHPTRLCPQNHTPPPPQI